MKHFFLLLLFCTLLSAVATAQPLEKDVTYQRLYWLRYVNDLKLGSGWTFHAEIEDRRYAFPDRQHQLLPVLALNKEIGQGWTAGAGFTYFLLSLPEDGDLPVTLVRPELRPHQELSYKQVLGRVSIRHRYLLEERFFHNTVDGELAPGYHFAWRARARLLVDVPIVKQESPKGSFSIFAYDEILLNFGANVVRNTFDQNRLAAGLSYGILDKLKVQVEVLNWFQQRSSGDEYFNRYVLRLSLIQTMDFAQKAD